MKLKKITAILSLITISLILYSCGSIAEGHARKAFTEESHAIPPDFGKYQNQILLIVLKNRSSYDKYLKKATKSYLGTYEFVTEDQINSDKYRNKTIYRYIFDYSNGSTSSIIYHDTFNHNTATTRSHVTFKQFYIKDRYADKTYISNYESGYFARAMKAYMQNLEIKRASQHKSLMM